MNRGVSNTNEGFGLMIEGTTMPGWVWLWIDLTWYIFIAYASQGMT